ncbi:MAG TPA: HigA family addiction module antitoxin [Pedomonas sp.]|uniref:HigA family addiction module antitoxin n=1 Tax=Pedomonas sp. TaxID=2976421 RepID=UPI002F42E663
MQAVVRAIATGHPGRFVKSEVVDANGLSVTEAAHVLEVTWPVLSTLLNGRSDLAPQMAVRIEKAFSVPIEDLMEMQTSFDIAEVRKRADETKVAPFAPKTASAQTEGTR